MCGNVFDCNIKRIYVAAVTDVLQILARAPKKVEMEPGSKNAGFNFIKFDAVLHHFFGLVWLRRVSMLLASPFLALRYSHP